jgi:hypothetical protein
MGKAQNGKLREGLRTLMTAESQLVYSLIALKREFCAYKVPNVWRYTYQGSRRYQIWDNEALSWCMPLPYDLTGHLDS